MGWYIRRSKKIGPFRLNLSKSGIGISAGFKGFRIGRDAKGRMYGNVSIPGTGIGSRSYLSERSRRKKALHKDSAIQTSSLHPMRDGLVGFLFLVAVVLTVAGHWIIALVSLLALCLAVGLRDKETKTPVGLNQLGGEEEAKSWGASPEATQVPRLDTTKDA